MTRRDVQRAERRRIRAREALAKLEPAERTAIFRELGCCTCSSLARKAAEHPAAAVGGLLGALVGAAIESAGEGGRMTAPARLPSPNLLYPLDAFKKLK